MEIENSKVTVIKYDNRENLDRYLSKLNCIDVIDIDLDMDLSSLKRELLIDEILNSDSINKKYFYIDIDTVRIKRFENIPSQRGVNKLVVINNLISNLNSDKNFRLIFGFSDNGFNPALIHRCNLLLEILGEKVSIKKSFYSVY